MSSTFNDSADSVWQTISDFGGIGKFVSAITNCTVEGSGVGSVRTISLGEGAPVVERLETMDAQAKTLSYSILESPLPVSGYVSTMELADLGGDRCELKWSSAFEASGAPEAEARGVIEGVYSMGFEGLKTIHGG